METGSSFVSYIGVAVFILAYEYGYARPMMDSLYGDHVYSGEIIPISGAVPHKIHSHEQNKHHQKSSTSPPSAAQEMKAQNSQDKNSNSNTSTAGGEMKTQKSSSYTSVAGEMKARKAKKIFDILGIDLSRIDLSQIDVTHKFDGKDSLQPSLCHDTYDDRYGVGKHFVRGARDVGFAILSEAEDIIDGLLGGLPLVPNIASGIGGGLKAVLCAIEDGFSDIGSDLDSALDFAKNGLVDFFKLKGPHPVLDIPVGIGGIAEEGVKAAGQVVGDAVGGVKNAVGGILNAL